MKPTMRPFEPKVLTLDDVLNEHDKEVNKEKVGTTIDKIMVVIGGSATLYFYPNNIYLHFLRSKADRIEKDDLERKHYFGGKYYKFAKVEEYEKDNNIWVKIVMKEVAN